MNGRDRPPEWPVAEDRESVVVQDKRGRKGGLNGTAMALIAALIVLVLLIAYLGTTRDPDQDKLTGKDVASNGAPAADPSKTCASRSTYDLIKRDIFRHAAQVRGSDQATFDKLSNYAAVRMENPVMESQDESSKAVNCSGSLSIDLPPGLAVVGGRQSLTADVDYTVQPAADGSGNVVLLRNAEAIITPLATLARVNQPVSPMAGVEANLSDQPTGLQPQAQQPAAPQPQASSGANPSFDCNSARTKGEVAVCSDAGLAALDRNMAAEYGRAMAGASSEQQALLRRTRDRFLAYRDRCPNRSCIGDAYTGRMREIRDIVEGRWQPPR